MMKSRLGLNLNCVDCEKYTHWIEILIRDEWNQPFNNVTGFIVDATGRATKITLGSKPIFLDTLAAGPVKLYLEMNEPQIWFKEAQAIEHKPNNDNPNLVKDFALAYVGKSAPIYLEATSGDFNTDHGNAIFVHDDGKPEYTPVELPERHQAGKADDLHFVTDKTYVVKVRAFNLFSLRIGMFFDGTCNNTYSSLWGYNQLERYYPIWKIHRDSSLKRHYESGTSIDAILHHPIDAKDLDEKVFEWPQKESFIHKFLCDNDEHNHIEEVAGSAANELTNIQKMYDLYPDDKFIKETDTFIHKEYITGIGTGNETIFAPAKESVFPGQANGTFSLGVEAKVITAIDQLCSSITGTNSYQSKNQLFDFIAKIVDDNQYDGIRKIEFDVYGFSRGAAAARHFINQILLSEKNNIFIPKFTQAITKSNLSLSPCFNWSNNENCIIAFAGILDTVAAINEIIERDVQPFDVLPNNRNGDVMLHLNSKRIQKAIHFTAHPKCEYRAQFGLNLFNDAPNFESYSLFGCHSDIGGGYYSQEAFSQNDYLLPVLEQGTVFSASYLNSKEKIQNKINKIKQKEKDVGWLVTDYYQHIENNPGAHSIDNWMGTLKFKRITNGNLSRLYLRLIYGLSYFNGVPLEPWDLNKKVTIDLNNHQIIYPLSRYISLPDNLNKLGDMMLHDAMQGKVDNFLFSSRFKEYLFKNKMIHHSAGIGLVLGPSEDDNGNYQRYLYECKE